MKKRIILASVVFGIVLVAGLGYYYTVESSAKTSARLDISSALSDATPVTAPLAAEANAKPVYPNSVVPGGVHSVAEAVFATDDPVVKAHYAKIDFYKLKRVVLTADVYASVSYRIGSNIFWTKKKHRIRAGEVAFTDGVHFIRGRCGNCYGETPAGPVSAAEPPEEVLDTPVATPVRGPETAVLSAASTPFIEAPRRTAVAGPIIAKPSRSRKWLFGFASIPIIAALWPRGDDAPPSPGLPASPEQPPSPVNPPPTNPPVVPETPPVVPETPPVVPETPSVVPETPPVVPETPPVIPEKPPVAPPPPVTPEAPPPVWQPPTQPTPIPPGDLPPPIWIPPNNPPEVPGYPPITPYNPPIDIPPDVPVTPHVTVTPEPGFFFMVAGGMAALLLAKKFRNRTK